MKETRKKLTALGTALLLAASTSLAGCGQSTNSSSTKEAQKENTGTNLSTQAQESSESTEPVTITYWHHDASDNIVTPLKKIIANFEAENPDIKVEFLALPADNFYQKYVTAVATNTAPDVFGIRDTELLALVHQGAILPMDDYVNEWEEKDNISDSVWESVSSYSDDGKIYMIPSYMNACIMWYNTKKM